MVFVSLGLRLRIEVEALNMVEALGAYTRHRTVSILKKVSKEGGVAYRIVVAPAISGQSIAYGYHKTLVELANIKKLPVCNECTKYEARGGFSKRATEGISHDDRILTCVVDDLTGFLAPEAKNGRRTSPVSFSYLVPDIESAKAALDSQFHVRYDFETMQHQPFTVESGTAIYLLSIAVDVDRIGRLSNGSYTEDRINRIELAFKALEVLIEGFMYGAKKSRYLPINEVTGAIAAISHPIPFAVSPPRVYYNGYNYINDTIERAKHYIESLKDFGENVKIMYIDREGVVKGSELVGDFAKRANTFTEMVEKIIREVRQMVEKKS